VRDLRVNVKSTRQAPLGNLSFDHGLQIKEEAERAKKAELQKDSFTEHSDS
jgi:hypothetical protein